MTNKKVQDLDILVFEKLVNFSSDNDLKFDEILTTYSKFYEIIMYHPEYKNKRTRVGVTAYHLTKNLYEKNLI
jgi:hypothetical protein